MNDFTAEAFTQHTCCVSSRALPASQDGRACTSGLAGLAAVRELRLEHVKVTCLPPALQDLSLIRCRLGPSPQLEAGTRLRSLHIASCTGQVHACILRPHACMHACCLLAHCRTSACNAPAVARSAKRAAQPAHATHSEQAQLTSPGRGAGCSECSMHVTFLGL